MTEQQPTNRTEEDLARRYGNQDAGYAPAWGIKVGLSETVDSIYKQNLIDNAFTDWPQNDETTELVRRATNLLHGIGRFVESFVSLSYKRMEVIEQLVEEFTQLFDGSPLDTKDFQTIKIKLSTLEGKLARA